MWKIVAILSVLLVSICKGQEDSTSTFTFSDDEILSVYMDDFATCKCLAQFSKTDKEITIENRPMNYFVEIFPYSSDYLFKFRDWINNWVDQQPRNSSYSGETPFTGICLALKYNYDYLSLKSEIIQSEEIPKRWYDGMREEIRRSNLK